MKRKSSAPRRLNAVYEDENVKEEAAVVESNAVVHVHAPVAAVAVASDLWDRVHETKKSNGSSSAVVVGVPPKEVKSVVQLKRRSRGSTTTTTTTTDGDMNHAVESSHNCLPSQTETQTVTVTHTCEEEKKELRRSSRSVVQPTLIKMSMDSVDSYDPPDEDPCQQPPKKRSRPSASKQLRNSNSNSNSNSNGASVPRPSTVSEPDSKLFRMQRKSALSSHHHHHNHDRKRSSFEKSSRSFRRHHHHHHHHHHRARPPLLCARLVDLSSIMSGSLRLAPGEDGAASMLATISDVDVNVHRLGIHSNLPLYRHSLMQPTSKIRDVPGSKDTLGKLVYRCRNERITPDVVASASTGTGTGANGTGAGAGTSASAGGPPEKTDVDGQCTFSLVFSTSCDKGVHSTWQFVSLRPHSCCHGNNNNVVVGNGIPGVVPTATATATATAGTLRVSTVQAALLQAGFTRDNLELNRSVIGSFIYNSFLQPIQVLGGRDFLKRVSKNFPVSHQYCVGCWFLYQQQQHQQHQQQQQATMNRCTVVWANLECGHSLCSACVVKARDSDNCYCPRCKEGPWREPLVFQRGTSTKTTTTTT